MSNQNQPMSSRFTIADIGSFLRLKTLAFPIIMVMYGALSVSPSVAFNKLLLPILVATSVHTFAFVSNDVVDLELDRTLPRRRAKPLVRGAISPKTALAFALLQLPISLLLTLIQQPPLFPYEPLFLSFLFIAIYIVLFLHSN